MTPLFLLLLPPWEVVEEEVGTGADDDDADDDDDERLHTYEPHMAFSKSRNERVKDDFPIIILSYSFC